jgi:predicted nucleotidyltransferase
VAPSVSIALRPAERVNIATDRAGFNATRQRLSLPYTGRMSAQHTFDPDGRWDGRTLTEIVPLVVDEIVAAFEPLEVILFGSVARGEDGPDSDIDLLVVFDHLEPEQKRPLMADVRRSITTLAPIDVLVADPDEIEARRDQVGSILYWPLREGRSVYRRARAHAG